MSNISTDNLHPYNQQQYGLTFNTGNMSLFTVHAAWNAGNETNCPVLCTLHTTCEFVAANGEECYLGSLPGNETGNPAYAGTGAETVKLYYGEEHASILR